MMRDIPFTTSRDLVRVCTIAAIRYDDPHPPTKGSRTPMETQSPCPATATKQTPHRCQPESPISVGKDAQQKKAWTAPDFFYRLPTIRLVLQTRPPTDPGAR
jgi:hypothetical protein